MYEKPRFAKPVSGSHNPHYEFKQPVKNLRELIDALDPSMDFCRYNILKSAIRWDQKPDLEYNIEKIIFYAGEEKRVLQMQKDNGGRP